MPKHEPASLRDCLDDLFDRVTQSTALTLGPEWEKLREETRKHCDLIDQRLTMLENLTLQLRPAQRETLTLKKRA